MATNWVDFRAVKNAVTMRMALDHYGVNWLRKRGDELAGRCPIHKGEGTDTFHVNLTKNAFHCFSCKAKGNVLDFTAAMEHCTARDAAVKLADWFSISTDGAKQSPAKRVAPTESRGEGKAENKPLTFQLKGIDHNHPYLSSRGITKGTAERFGVGYFSGKGSMSGRIVIPIHNAEGELVAYAGRAIDESEPKYKFPGGFHKGSELFNFHRVLKEAEANQPIVLVEGFFDCMKVDQAGFPAMALMGCALSEAQEAMLLDFYRVIIMLDGDEAGWAAANEIARRLVRNLFVRVVEVGAGKQPDQFTAEEIRGLLAGVI